MQQEEVGLVNDRSNERQCAEINGMSCEGQPRHVSACKRPKHSYFNRRPDRQTGAKGTDHVVDVLTSEKEDITRLLSRPLPVVFESRPLRAQYIEPQLKGSKEEENGDAVR